MRIGTRTVRGATARGSRGAAATRPGCEALACAAAGGAEPRDGGPEAGDEPQPAVTQGRAARASAGAQPEPLVGLAEAAAADA